MVGGGCGAACLVPPIPLPAPSFQLLRGPEPFAARGRAVVRVFSARFCFSADMSERARLLEVLKKEVRSLLIAAQEGLSPAQLEQEYLDVVGKPLPLRELGFQSTLELAAGMPAVVRVCPRETGTFVLRGEVVFPGGWRDCREPPTGRR